jgi:arsenate reductase
MITIYHNPRCRKSREGLSVLEDSGKEFAIVKYLEEGLTKDTLEQIIEKLAISPLDLVRKNEAIWKEKYKGRPLSETAIIEAMVRHPKLMERPVVVHNDKAVIGRPSSEIRSIL